MFAEDVQEELLRGGHDIEAHFCKILRQCHEAEDQPVIPGERCVRSLKLKAWLMNRYDLAAFHPPSQYVNGIPRVTFVGLVCSIDAHIQTGKRKCLQLAVSFYTSGRELYG
ncbi:hypothetical protein DPMN_028307 [Dreissena polymorpha]|uniref:Uncharacterized protein n=1 Tax=Dreissena polymorpha TaxID=45954 RepID=A0A9D4LV85_DREPO|nr:hypothetical protein DPMN_028307 [Dreissena polymorpha]